MSPNGIATTVPQGKTVLAPPAPAASMRRSGITALDALLCGGFEAGGVWSVAGAPGVGKTLLALHFLAEGLACNEPSLYITAAEPPTKIAQCFAKYWPNLEAGIAKRQLVVLDPSPFFTELRLGKDRRHKNRVEAWDEVWRFVQDVTKQSRDMGARRIVIDPLTPLLLAYESAIDLWDTVQTLVGALGENRNATTLLTHVALPEPSFVAIGDTLQALCTGALQMEARLGERGPQVAIQALKRRHAPLAGREISVHIGAGGRMSHLESMPRTWEEPTE